MTGKEIGRIWRKMVACARLDVDGISAHSGRVGTCQDLVAAGLGIAEIQVAGGWKSPTMVARYSEALDIGRGAVAKLATLQNR